MKYYCCFVLVLVSVSLHAQLTDFRHVRFNKADSVASANFGAPLFDLPLLSARLTESLTSDEEKFRAIFKWVCSNIDFDFELFSLNWQKRNKYDSPEALEAWNKKVIPRVYRTLVMEKKTVCTGYAWLVHELAQHAGITCVIVDGYGRNASANIRKSGKANHSWNAVKLNNKWYLCDPTWASGVIDRDGEFVRQYENSYFLSNPKMFIRNHYPLDSMWTLLSEDSGLRVQGSTFISGTKSSTLEEFLNAPLIYSSAYQHDITQLYPATFDIITKKDEPVNFRFESSTVMERIELAVNKDQEVKSYQPLFGKDDKGMYCFNHTFREKGRHVVHVILNGSYTVTYTVTVVDGVSS